MANGKVSDQVEGWLAGDHPKTLGNLIELFDEKSVAVVFMLLMAVPALPLPTGGATHVLEVITVLVAFQRTGDEGRLPVAAEHLVGLLRSWGPGPHHLTGLALTGITVPSRLGPRFVDALVSHRLLRAETLQKLTSGGVKTADGQFLPYDFGGSIEGAGHFIGHGGGAPGMNGELMHFLDSGYTVIVLANRDPPVASFIASFTANRLPAN